MTLGDIIKRYRNDHALSMDAFSERSGISKAYISLLEKNRHPKTGKEISPSIQCIRQAAQGMNMDFDDLFALLDGKVEVNTPQQSQAIQARKIPVLGRVAAGIPINAITEIIDTEEISEDMAKTGDFFALQIQGDSMEPKISNGDVVIVRQQDDAETGDTVIALINGDDAVCKRLRKYKEGLELISTNPSYAPLYFDEETIKNKPVKIIGKVVELRAKF
jgi:repressor LexA